MSDLLIEVRCEELPPSMVQPALDGLKAGLLNALDGIPKGEVRIFATPRRIAVAIADVADARPAVEKLVTGPPADRAFVDGQPTQAAVGFAKGKGLGVEAIEIVDGPKGRVIAVRVKEGGDPTRALLEKSLDGIVRGLPFGKSMEWGRGGVRWGRPIQGVAALFGGEPLAGIAAGEPITDRTEGHRFAPDTAFHFRSVDAWLTGLRKRWVEPDLAVREATIRGQLAQIAAAEGADPIVDDDLLGQIVHLVEAPNAVVCTFEAELLHLPPRLLVQSMKVHQRYFPIFRAGALTNRFVAVANNPVGDPAVMSAGFARVLRARFHDAKFFFAEDQKKPLAAHGERLSGMRWIKGLGSMGQKQARLAHLAGRLVSEGFVAANVADVVRAGELAKCDLVTAMVGEFPELQGHMGRLYAKAQGAPDAVALAIEEHYQPRFADDAVASSPAGVAVAVADRLDTLVGCFGVGLAPKGNDPLGLRRAALGLVRTLIDNGSTADLRALFGLALRSFHDAVRAAPEGYQAWTKERGTAELPQDVEGQVEALVEFALARFKAQAVAEGATADLVDAVQYGGEARPLVIARKLAALRGIAGTPEFAPMMETFKRVLNISRDAEGREGPLTEPSEIALAEAIARVEGGVREAAERMQFADALDAMLSLREPVAQFFVHVMVMAEDPVVRGARVALLKRIGATFLHVADFSRISTR